jgi:hypothetical protein
MAEQTLQGKVVISTKRDGKQVRSIEEEWVGKIEVGVIFDFGDSEETIFTMGPQVLVTRGRNLETGLIEHRGYYLKNDNNGSYLDQYNQW